MSYNYKITCDTLGNYHLMTIYDEYIFTNPDMTLLEKNINGLYSITCYNVDIYKYDNIIIDYNSFSKYLNLNKEEDIIKFLKK